MVFQPAWLENTIKNLVGTTLCFNAFFELFPGCNDKISLSFKLVGCYDVYSDSAESAGKLRDLSLDLN